MFYEVFLAQPTGLFGPFSTAKEDLQVSRVTGSFLRLYRYLLLWVRVVTKSSLNKLMSWKEYEEYHKTTITSSVVPTQAREPPIVGSLVLVLSKSFP